MNTLKSEILTASERMAGKAGLVVYGSTNYDD